MGAAQILGESDNVARKAHGNELRCENGLSHVSIHQLTMHRAYADIAYSNNFPSVEKPFYTLGDISSADMYVWDRQKLVPEDGEGGAQRRKCYISIKAICLVLRVKVAIIPKDVHTTD